MDLRQLRHLTAIVEKGSFSAAAKSLNLTQPALTRSMNALEQSVAAALLVRKTNGIEPTSAGQVLYDYARLLLAGAENARADITRIAQGIGGELTVGIGTHLAELVLPAVLSKFAALHPHLSISIKTGMIEQLLPMVLDGKIELVGTMIPADGIQGLIAYERVFTTLDYVYAGLNHKLAGTRATIPFEDLVEQRWVALDTPHAQIYFNRFFSSAGAGNPRQVFRSDSLAMLRSMIESGDWLGIMPAEYMKKSEARSLRVKGLPLVRACGLLTRADIPLRPIVAEFGSVMRTEMLRLQHPRASLPVG